MGDFTSLKVIVDNLDPFLIVKGDNGSIREISGYLGELWNIMETTLNFKSNYLQFSFKDGKTLLGNGTADVILAPVIVTNSDVHGFDFSIPVGKTWYELYVKRSGIGATSVSYLETWSPSLWIAFTLTLFTLTTVIWSMIKIRRKYGLDEVEERERTNVDDKKIIRNWKTFSEPTTKDPNSVMLESDYASFGSCFLVVLGSVTYQGFHLNSQSTSMRIIMLVTLFFGYLMLNSYSAVLVSRLAVGKEDILFPTLDSVAVKGTHTLCVREGCFAYLLFKFSEESDEIRPEWKNIVNQGICKNTTRDVDISSVLCKDGTVILETPFVISRILEARRECTITKMPGHYAFAYTSLIMRRHFKFKKKINEIILKLMTSGVMDYLQKKWLNGRIPQNLEISRNEPITINHIEGVLMVYGCALCLSILILLIEKFMTYWKHGRKKATIKPIKPFIN